MFKIIRTAVGCASSYGLIHKLQTNGVYIIGTDIDRLSAGAHLCNKYYTVPNGNDDTYISEMIRICKQEEPNMIISGPEEEVLALSKNRTQFEKIGVELLMPNYESVSICSNKLDLFYFLRSHDIPTPHVFKDMKYIYYPCIIKPKYSRGSRDIKIIDRKALDSGVYNNDKNLVQEYISGTEYSVDCFGDKNGNALSIIPRIRIKTDSGICTYGITKKHTEITKICMQIVKKLKLYGPSCIQCIEDENGEIFFFDVNVRFGGGSILSIEANPKVIDYLIDIMEGKKLIPNLGFKENLTMTRYYSEYFFEEGI